MKDCSKKLFKDDEMYGTFVKKDRNAIVCLLSLERMKSE